MHSIKYIALALSCYLAGCSHIEKIEYAPQSELGDTKIPGTTIPGTKTVLVKIGVDNRGTPTVFPETVIIRKGQRVIFVGPNKFDLKFITSKQPFDNVTRISSNAWGISTNNAVINIPIYNKQKQEKLNSNEYAKIIKYEIIINGKKLDPYMIFPPE